MRVSIRFDALLVGTLFTLLLVFKLSLVQGQDDCSKWTCNSATGCIDNPCTLTFCWIDYGICWQPSCGHNCLDESNEPNHAICAGNLCDKCLVDDSGTNYVCTRQADPTCGIIDCNSATSCTDQTESGCTRCNIVCTQPKCGDDCFDYDSEDYMGPSDAICAGNKSGCTKCLDDGFGWYACQEPPGLPSSSPSGIPSQKPSALLKKKTKKTKTGKKKAKMPMVQKKKARKSKT